MQSGEGQIYGLIAPHAPTLLEDEQDGRSGAVIQALRSLGHFFLEEEIDVVVAASTHWLADEMLVDGSAHHRTIHDYYGFRVQLQYDAPGHADLAAAIVEEANRMLLFPSLKRHGVDHAVTIPMHFLFPDKSMPVVPVSVGGCRVEAFRRGRAIAEAVRKSGLRVLFLASGSLSHDLQAYLDHDFDPEHERFDRHVLDLLERGRGMEMDSIEPALINRAMPEGWFRDLYMLLGAMGSRATARVMAYERLPGVGLGVACFERSASTEQDDIAHSNYIEENL
ncbi:dioxygenase family protein [Leptonema illini]|uniref:Extradiol ring-cleavage dioxygenase class III protein subunit B n=1 Tax=Leptonema illini DSM 21528 TaxID=929563 RepID=H2CC52_9LEPT|nr:extradiol ring-cleavage dioxygenase class III protein subunit B [Leptonema illini]EHQ05281.1 Extradiol ring-cleavage dioxygenase class III protein subunit B [Leptonema illini DSM 21528]